MEKPNVKVIYHPGYGFQYVHPKTETSEENHPCEHAPHKENNMEYPEEIYAIRDGGLLVPLLRGSTSSVGWGRRNAYNIGCARGYQSGYEAGKAEQADSLEGFSNLTEAIKAGDPIDYEKLDGLNVHCVNPDVGGLHWKLVRNKLRPADIPAGWRREDANNLNVTAFVYSWTGSYGWSLWIEGEIPLVRKTADQLEVGTYFLGELGGRSIDFMYVGRPIDTDKEKTIYYAPDMLKAVTPASEWVVIEEYGPFQKPEDK